MIPRIPHPWHPGEYPYHVFEGTGVSPQTTHDGLLDASLQLQAEDRLDRSAFDALRTQGARFVTDFFLYNPELADPLAAVEDLLDEISADEHQERK